MAEFNLDNETEDVIQQTIVPSYGTKLCCTNCGREDWHTLILRRTRGLIEGLCKQRDGNGCFPNSTRVVCRFVDNDQVQCTQLVQYEIMDLDGRKITECCADHIGVMMPKGSSGHTLFSLHD